jgi:hypothetical protein
MAKIWRKFEFRGRDPNRHPFLDFGFVGREGSQLTLTSHMLREPLQVEGAESVLPAFQQFYEGKGVSDLRYKVLWDDDGPVDTPFEEGWFT